MATAGPDAAVFHAARVSANFLEVLASRLYWDAASLMNEDVYRGVDRREGAADTDS